MLSLRGNKPDTDQQWINGLEMLVSNQGKFAETQIERLRRCYGIVEKSDGLRMTGKLSRNCQNIFNAGDSLNIFPP